MRQFRTENPIILAKEDVSKTPDFTKKVLTTRNDALETIFIKQIFKGENSNGRDE